MKLTSVTFLLSSFASVITASNFIPLTSSEYEALYKQGPEALRPYLEDEQHRNRILNLKMTCNSSTDMYYVSSDYESLLTDAIKRGDTEMAVLLIEHGADILEKCSYSVSRYDYRDGIAGTESLSLSAFDIASAKCSEYTIFKAFLQSKYKDALTFDKNWVEARLNSCCYALVETLKDNEIISTELMSHLHHDYYNVSGVYRRCGKEKAGLLIMRGYRTFEPYSDLVHKLVADESLEQLEKLKAERSMISNKSYISLEYRAKSHYLNVDLSGDDVTTPLILALQKNRDDIVSLLLSSGAHPNRVDANRNVPLFHAINNKSMSQIEGLLQAGGNLNLMTAEGITLIQHAFRTDRAIFDQLVGFENNSQPPEYTYIDLNTANNLKMTIIYTAIEANEESLVAWLIEKGVALDHTDIYGNTPFMHACAYSSDAVITLILNQMMTKFEGEKLKELVNVRNQNGFNALHLIMTNSSAIPITTKEMITHNGIDVNDARISHGITPLMLASEYGSTADIEFLLSSGADLNAVDERGRNAIFYATERQSIEMIKFLIEKGLSIEVVNKAGDSPLHEVIKGENPIFAKDLLKLTKFTIRNLLIYSKALKMAREGSFQDQKTKKELVDALEIFIGRLRYFTNPRFKRV